LEIAIAFGKVLRRLRKEVGLTQEQLGFEAELERNFISMLELGQRQPTLTTIYRLSLPLKVLAPAMIAQVDAELAKGGRRSRGR
jgi:transcriptional regulator with XRE-family HTH domain